MVLCQRKMLFGSGREVYANCLFGRKTVPTVSSSCKTVIVFVIPDVRYTIGCCTLVADVMLAHGIRQC